MAKTAKTIQVVRADGKLYTVKSIGMTKVMTVDSLGVGRTFVRSAVSIETVPVQERNAEADRALRIASKRLASQVLAEMLVWADGRDPFIAQQISETRRLEDAIARR